MSDSDRFLAIQTLVSGLAHEVRNPLNAAKLQLELLERRLHRGEFGALDEPARRAASELLRLERLIDDFLAFAEREEIARSECDLVELVRATVAAEQHAARHLGVTLAVGTLPDRLVTNVDPIRLGRALKLLVTNALEAIGAGGNVRVDVRENAERISIAVRDDGPGIPADLRKRVFEPFFSTKPTGTGLGLTIARSIATLHGGAIQMESSASGTTMSIDLPRQV